MDKNINNIKEVEKVPVNQETYFENSAIPPHMAANRVLYQDIVSLLESSYLKILRVNLTSMQHEDILVSFREVRPTSGYSESIDEWLRGFAESGGVHPEDVGDYLKFTNLEFIKTHFNNTNEDLIIRYRRSLGNDYHWVNMVLKKSAQYTPDNQCVMLYIQDVDRQMTQDSQINMALFESFNVYVSELSEKEAIMALLKVLCEFYDADVCRVSGGGGNLGQAISYSYSSGRDAAPSAKRWIEHFGANNEYEMVIENPIDNINTRILLRGIMMLSHIILNKKHEEEYQNNLKNQLRIISGLSNIYFCVYLVNTARNIAKRVHSVDYLTKLFGDEEDPEKLFDLVDKNLVEEGFKEEMRSFNDISKWSKNLADKSDISMEFKGPNMGWTRANIIVLQRDSDGVPFEYIYTVREINDQKEREESYNKSIQRALEYANNANQAKSRFLSNMSHDIRTPMNAIIGYTNLIKEHLNDPEKTLEYVENMAAAGNHLMNLINDVLDMSQIESGRMVLRKETLDVVETVENIRSMNISTIENKGISFDVDTEEVKHPMIISDSLRLNQVLINLVGNAIKFTNAGGTVTVAVSEKKGRKNASMYCFKVKDTGIGIDEAFIDKIFEPFERERTATESNIVGTGLGLSIVKNIVELMEGTISVSSVKGEGTEFTVEIPFEFVDNAKTLEKEEEGRSEDIDITKLKILLVEDNAINRKIAHAIFGDRGVTLEEAHNGQEAVDTLKEKGPGYYDLVLMDLQMPVLNGIEATEIIRNMPDEKLANIPIIAMTANAFEEDRRASLKAGMNAHISKPIDIDVLINTIKSVV